MATRVTFDETKNKMTVEKSNEPTVVHFTPKIVMEMKKAGKLWTLKATPRGTRQV